MLKTPVSCNAFGLRCKFSLFFRPHVRAGTFRFQSESRSSRGSTSNSLCMILSNSSLSMPDALANLNKLLMSVLICCLIASSAWLWLAASRSSLSTDRDDVDELGRGWFSAAGRASSTDSMCSVLLSSPESFTYAGGSDESYPLGPKFDVSRGSAWGARV